MQEEEEINKSKEMLLYKKIFIWFLIAEAIVEDRFWNNMAI